MAAPGTGSCGNMMTVDTDAPTVDDDMGGRWLVDVWAKIRRRKWTVLAFTLAALLIAVVYLRTADYVYTATLRVSPAPSAAGGGPELGALGSLASLTGLGVGSSETATPFRLYVEGVYAREVADRLSRDDAIMHTVFAGEWDTTRRSYRQRQGMLSSLKDGVFGVLGIPTNAWAAPDGARLQGFIGSAVVVTQSVKSPLVTVSFGATDPAFATRFLAKLDRTIDDYLREKALARSRQNVTYLSQKLAMVTLAEHRQVLAAALASEERQLMLASNPAPYAADLFDRVTASLGPTSPRPLPVLLSALVAGLLLGIAAAIVWPLHRRALLSERTAAALP